jgi:uroporphyrinogen-III synthase
VSSLLAATTGTGLLLTRRNRSRAFLAYAPRQAGSASPYLPLAAEERARPATAVFMGSAGLRELVADHLACGWDRGTPGAIVLAAGTENQHVCQAPLSELADVSLPSGPDGKPLPGLILLGEVAVGPPWPRHGPLGGRRVLFTGSRMLADRTVNAIRDRDGIPLPLPLLELEPDPGILPTLARLPEFDWLVLGSPAAAEILLAMLSQSHVDLRRLPRILTAGPATAAILAAAGIFAELVADPPYGVAGLQERIAGDIRPGQRILRLRSELADTALSDLLAATGAKVDDAVLYRNRPPTSLLPLPDFDAILFASDSAVKRFHEAYGAEPLHGKMAGVVGEPTRRALAAVEARIERVVMPRESTVEAMVDALAQACVNRWIDEQSKEEE